MILSCSVGRHGEKMRGLGSHVEIFYRWQYIMPSRHLIFDINTERLHSFIKHSHPFISSLINTSAIAAAAASQQSARSKNDIMNFFGQKEEQPKGPDPLFAGELVGECMNLCFNIDCIRGCWWYYYKPLVVVLNYLYKMVCCWLYFVLVY
jgi:hypothetical protein